MKRLSPISIALAVSGIGLATVLSGVSPVMAADGPLIRHSAEFFKFDGTEFATSFVTKEAGVGGAIIYKKSVAVPADSNTIYVTITATGDAHGGASLQLSCFVNGALCRPQSGPGIDEAPGGWITLVKLPQDVESPTGTNNCNDGGGGTADCHDNNIAYQWCARIGGKRFAAVNIKIGSSIAGNSVFLEKAHVYIDTSRIEQSGACVAAELTASAADGVTGPIAKTTRQHKP